MGYLGLSLGFCCLNQLLKPDTVINIDMHGSVIISTAFMIHFKCKQNDGVQRPVKFKLEKDWCILAYLK